MLRRYGRTPRADLRATLLNMGMADGAQYLIREYALPLDRRKTFFRDALGHRRIVRDRGAQTRRAEDAGTLKAEGARMCICSNTWSEQCKTVLTRLGMDAAFEFFIEAQGPRTKAARTCFLRH